MRNLVIQESYQTKKMLILLQLQYIFISSHKMAFEYRSFKLKSTMPFHKKTFLYFTKLTKTYKIELLRKFKSAANLIYLS